MANSREAEEAALEVYETLVSEIGPEHARKALHVLEGIRVPALGRIELMQKRKQFEELLTQRPSVHAHFVASHLRVALSTAYRWLAQS